jgi:cytochrome P450
MSATTDAVSTPSDVPFLNIVDPAFDFIAPEVTLAQAKNWYAECPLGLVVLRYREAQELLRDPRLNHNGKGFLEMSGIFDGPIYDWFVPMIVNHDGDHHRRLRGLVNKAFTPRMINNLRPFIRASAERLAEDLGSGETCDFIEDFCNPLPFVVMCKLLGVPLGDNQTLRVWTTDIGMVFSLAHGGDIPARVEAAVVGLSGYVDSLIADKRTAPADDLISALVAIQQDEGRISSDELRNLIVTLVFAAHDTTRFQLANAMVAFAEHPEQWTLLARQPELVPQAVEEIMRWCPSTSLAYRFPTEDFDYQGLHIETGAFVMISVRIAQRDTSVFPHGHTFDITATSKAPPLQFGGGPHHCLGAALARTELSEALPALVSRRGQPSIVGPVTWRPAIGIYGPNELPVRFS